MNTKDSNKTEAGLGGGCIEQLLDLDTRLLSLACNRVWTVTDGVHVWDMFEVDVGDQFQFVYYEGSLHAPILQFRDMDSNIPFFRDVPSANSLYSPTWFTTKSNGGDRDEKSTDNQLFFQQVIQIVHGSKVLFDRIFFRFDFGKDPSSDKATFEYLIGSGVFANDHGRGGGN